MTTTIKGKVHHIGPVESIGSNGFTKRLLVIDTGAKYDNIVPIEAKKDNCAKLDGLSVSDNIEVEIYIGGREYNGKFYPSLTYAKHVAAERMQPPAQRSQAMPDVASESDEQDLPF